MPGLILVSVLLGLVIGSFANVVAYRVPRELSLVSPPSSCPSCGRRIATRDNIPVIGWLVLRGRCRECSEKISGRYPVVEAGTGVLFGLAALKFGPTWELPGYLWFFALTVVLVLTDFDHQRVPNAILLPGGVAGVALLAAGALTEGRGDAILRGLGGGVALFALFLLLALATRGGFGMGDVKLAGLVGIFTAYLSWWFLVVAVLAAFLLGGVVAVFLLVTGRKGRKDRIAFAPALIAGSWLVILCGPVMVSWITGHPG